MTLPKKLIASIVLFSALLIGGHAFAATAVRDEAGLFSSDAVAKATETANSIKKDTDRDVMVETLAQLPADAPTAGAEFNAWAIRRAENEKASGVYVLVVKSPGKVFVKADKTTLKLLPQGDADRVRDVMLASFKEKRFDQGVQGGLDEMRIRMLGNKDGSGAAPAPRASAQSPSSGAPYGSSPSRETTPAARQGSGWGVWMCVIPLLVIVVGLFLVRRIFSRGQAGQGGQGGYGGPPPLPGQQGYNQNYPGGMPNQGAGGFGRGAMGGLLGGLGGAWLYDRFFHGGGSGGGLMGGGGNQAYGAPPDASSPSTSNYSGSSGDFGDSSSSDSGGGGGGGDFGGGDFGGGGDSGSSGDF